MNWILIRQGETEVTHATFATEKLSTIMVLAPE